MILFRIAAPLFPALLLAGCIGDETATAYGAADKTWMLEELGGASFSARATLVFPEPGKIAGEAPCNSYSASMTVPYPWFEAGPLATTRRLCPQISAEETYLQALSDMTLIEALGDTLILSNDTETTMIFKAGG